MLEKLDLIEKRYEELNRMMADPEVAADHLHLKELAQEQAEIEDIVKKYREYKATTMELEKTQAMLDEELSAEMRGLVEEEIEALKEREEDILKEIRLLLLPRDPRDERDVIVEIRAGTGGDEASLFAADLYRIYTRYAERHSWATDLLSFHETGVGGFKEVVFEVKGKGAYSRLKYESGVHRVQRVPITEASGRIHTSTATVAVLPQAEEVEVEINPDDLRIDVYRSSGPGGQHMQKTSSAVRITHVPTGITASCESTRSQFQNKARAMAVLRARLYDIEERKRLKELGEARRSQIGTGERSEKIRTYNFPQNRVTDHRIGLTVYRLEEVLEGELDEFIEELATREQAEKLRSIGLDQSSV